MADRRTPGWGGGRAKAELLEDGVRVQETLGLLPSRWWVKQCPGASAGLLVGRVKSWRLVVGPRGPRPGGWAQFLTQLAAGSRVSQSLHWPVSG